MSRSDDLYSLPPDLPVPVDDGACDHLPGMAWPAVRLRTTSGARVSLAEEAGVGAGTRVGIRTQVSLAVPVREGRDRGARSGLIVYFYPRTGLPDQDPPGGLAVWDAIPGARGCTPQACGYRDHHADLRDLGYRVYGVSTQDTAYQREVVERLHLPFDLLSDERLELANALRLPTFTVAGQTLIRRLTLVGDANGIESCIYPAYPPDADAANVLAWIRARESRR